MKPSRISRTLFQVNNLRIRFHVPLDEYHNEFEFNNKLYTSLTVNPYITIEILTNGKSDMTKSIVITDKNIFSIITATDTIISNICNNAIYAMDGTKVIIYSDMAEKYKVIRTLSNGAIMYKPIIVYDNNDISYEGVALYINNTANSVELTMDMLDALRYCLSKIDFIAYSQLMINYYQTYYAGSVSQPTHKENKPKQKIDWSKPPQEGMTTSTFTRNANEFEKLIGS